MKCPGKEKYHCSRKADHAPWHCAEGSRDCFSADIEQCTFYPEPLIATRPHETDCVTLAFDAPEQFLTRAGAIAIKEVFTSQVRADSADVEVITSLTSPHYKVNIFAIDQLTTELIKMRLHYMTASGKMLRLQLAKAVGFAPIFAANSQTHCVRHEKGSANFPESGKPCPMASPTPMPSAVKTIKIEMVWPGNIYDYDRATIDRVRNLIATVAGVGVEPEDVKVSMASDDPVAATALVTMRPTTLWADALREFRRIIGTAGKASILFDIEQETNPTFDILGENGEPLDLIEPEPEHILHVTPLPTPTLALVSKDGTTPKPSRQSFAAKQISLKARSHRLQALAPSQLLSDLEYLSEAQ